MHAALALHLAGMREDGEPAPEPAAADPTRLGDAVFVEVGAA